LNKVNKLNKLMQEYNPKEIESKWQEFWEKKKLYKAEDDSTKPKFYALMEFPYPSGDGLHTGHVRGYTAMDIVARKRRMEGFEVLYPIGWDAFGLPTENYAIKTGRPPAEITKENTDNFRREFKSLGMSFDWAREVNTTDPEYYKWTQWLFLKFLEHKLAYKAKIAINWCPKDKIGLANEEVVNGCCERCGTSVEKKEKEQWMLAITKYAERLDKDLDEVDYPERVKVQQRNWIGKSEGAEIEFGIKNYELRIKVFTTRPDTIFGATYMVLAPEHPLITNYELGITNKEEVEKYVQQSKNKKDIDRSAEGKEKTGVELKGVKAINPANQEEISIWIADYVLPHYGTGAIMAVPADDERDEEFANKHKLPITRDYKKAGFEDFGKKSQKFKLRDWVFSRQRYWGEPIPIIHCDECGMVAVPEEDLPVRLPEVAKYEPTDTGESPLASLDEWVNVKCPKCSGKAKRETDTMPNWAGSSWYFYRYLDHKNKNEFASKEKLKHWMPVDWYNGGMEHTTLHLLYSRFWNKFLFDIGLVPIDEPYKKRTSHGLVLAEGGEKMSKSTGNVINPSVYVERFGADTLRIYEMFMGPFEQAIAWNEDSLVGPRRFLEKVWKLSAKLSDDSNNEDSTLLHQTIKKVSEDIENMNFNTAISALMIFVNTLEKQNNVFKEEFEVLLKLLNPFAPHITEELWSSLGYKNTLGLENWPKFDPEKLTGGEVTMAVQVNGKHRANLIVAFDAGEDEIRTKALELPEVKKWLEGGMPKRIIVVLAKIVNIVV